MIEASVIIPTYNRGNLLKLVLEALFKQDYPKDRYEIIVVDDGSTDNTEGLIDSFDKPTNFSYIRLSRSGIAKARNIGIREARGETIVFIDSDLFVTPSFLREHMKFQEGDNKIIVQGPVIHTYNLENPFIESPKITDLSQAFFVGGNVSIKKKYLVEAGLFDEDFKYGWDDLEIGVRLKKLGLKAVRSSSAIGYHYRPRFTPENLALCEEKERERAESAILFYKKHPTMKVRLMTQNLPIFFFLESVLSRLIGAFFPSKEKIISYLAKEKRDLWLTLFVNFYHNLLYVNYLRKENEKFKGPNCQ
ncbi:TPA: family 2 glycosyl transferase [bacterium]|nr:family 2 glycosyl transferase [bacterium]